MISLGFLSCDSDDYPHTEVPSVILNKFWIHFPNATDVEFTKSGENFEVEFEYKGQDAEALIEQPGIILQEKIEVSFEELPVEIQKSVRKIGRHNIKNFERVKTKEQIIYQMKEKRFWFDKKMVMDEAGNLVSASNYWD